MTIRIITIILLSSAFSAVAMVNMTSNKLGLQQCGVQGKSQRCYVDRSAFNPKLLASDIIDIDFGPGRRYTCRSNGRGSSTCDSGLFGNKVGTMNVITRGKNSLGETFIFGSTSVGGDICHFSPDATGVNTIVECKPSSEFPSELDAIVAADL